MSESSGSTEVSFEGGRGRAVGPAAKVMLHGQASFSLGMTSVSMLPEELLENSKLVLLLSCPVPYVHAVALGTSSNSGTCTKSKAISKTAFYDRQHALLTS